MIRLKPAVRAAVAATFVAMTSPAMADPRDLAPLPTQEGTFALAELEHAFWYCDYLATTKGVLAAPMAACRFATEELMRAKFEGDFNALLQWWKSNKPAEHRKMAQLLD